jgi:uncharacterized protein
MTREQALRILAANREKLRDFAVESVAIFGSVARNEATAASDVDVLVEFKKDARVGLFGFVRVQRFLSGILGCPVDLVTLDALRQEIRQDVLREAVHAA